MLRIRTEIAASVSDDSNQPGFTGARVGGVGLVLRGELLLNGSPNQIRLAPSAAMRGFFEPPTQLCRESYGDSFLFHLCQTLYHWCLTCAARLAGRTFSLAISPARTHIMISDEPAAATVSRDRMVPGGLCSVIFEVRHDTEGEFHRLITAWATTIEEEQSYVENV